MVHVLQYGAPPLVTRGGLQRGDLGVKRLDTPVGRDGSLHERHDGGAHGVQVEGLARVEERSELGDVIERRTGHDANRNHGSR